MSASGALAAPIPDNGCSSTDVCVYTEQLHATANGDQTRDDDVHSHIVELSEIIDHDIRNNTWKSNLISQQKTIFRVPKERLHASDKITYQPMFLSIGPYHGGINATEEMRRNEQGKLSILNMYIPSGGGQSVVEYMEAVESMEAKARSCYEGDVEMDRYAFCRMLLLDAFQLIALLDRCFGMEVAPAAAAGGATTADDESSQGGSGIIKTRDLSMTVHDLTMLENQIPFFVVEKIYELYYGNTNAETNSNGNNATQRPVRELAWNTIKNIMGGVPPAPNHAFLEYSFQNLVHVCHVYLKPTGGNVSTETLHQKLQAGRYGRFRRATEYYDAGVKFRRWCTEEASASSSSSSSSSSSQKKQQQQQQQQQRPMLDVTFTNGMLSIALQKIDEMTGYILRNVLAYEQKYYRKASRPEESYVTAYVMFMSQLLGSAEDVALLSRRGVIENLLGSDDEVCALFRGLAGGLFFDPESKHYLKPVGMALKDYCSYRTHRWRAWVFRHRFSNPWLVAAWVFGAAAVLGTIIQTVFTVLSYVNQPHA